MTHAFYPGAWFDLTPTVLCPETKNWIYVDIWPSMHLFFSKDELSVVEQEQSIITWYIELFKCMKNYGFEMIRKKQDLFIFENVETQQIIKYYTNTDVGKPCDNLSLKKDISSCSTMCYLAFSISCMHSDFFPKVNMYLLNDRTYYEQDFKEFLQWECKYNKLHYKVFFSIKKIEWVTWIEKTRKYSVETYDIEENTINHLYTTFSQKHRALTIKNSG